MINRTYEGGSPHAPDMCTITPVFMDGSLVGFCGSIAHKGDIGGPVPGSCSGQAREIFNEGLQIPAVRYQARDVPNGDLERIIAANSRTPELVLGDIRGQLGADRLGERRLIDLIGKYGEDKILACFDRLLAASEQRMRAAIAEWPDGRFEAERFIDDDGIELDKPVRVHVAVEKRADAIHFDFAKSAGQTRGPANIRPPLVRAAGSGSRSIIIGGRSTYTGKGYVQYEIVGGGAGARASRDGASGTTVNQTNAKIAAAEIIESEFPTRVLRFDLIRDSGGAGEFRGGLGIRREYLNLAEARFSIRSAKHVIAPNGIAGGTDGRTGDIWINPDTDKAKRLPTRYADYPLQAGDTFRLDTPGGGGYGDPLRRDPQRVLADVREGDVSPEAAEKHYGVVVALVAGSWSIDHAATVERRARI